MQGLIGKSFNKLDSDELNKLFNEHDILLFSETWGNALFNYDKYGFKNIILNRVTKHKRARRDSGGLIIYIADHLYHDDIFIKAINDCILLIKLKGLSNDYNDDVYVFLCYNIPTGSSRQVVVEQDIFHLLTDEIITLENEHASPNIIITGDFNSRVGNNNDFVDDDFINADILPDDYIIDIPLPRSHKDVITNDHGLNMLNFCKQTGFRIMNGRVCEDKNIGAFTCIKAAGCSTVDYVLCKTDFMKYFTHFVVLEPNILSDHCALSFAINGFKQTVYRDKPDNLKPQVTEYKYVWDAEKNVLYNNALNEFDNLTQLHMLTIDAESVSNCSEVDDNINNFYNYMTNIVDPLFKKNIKRNNSRLNTNKNEWFDNECDDKRKIFHRNLRYYSKEKSDENRHNMTEARSNYKTCIRQKRALHNKNKTKQLEDFRFNNAREYWKMLKYASCGGNTTNISNNDFYTYFKAVNNPDSHFFQADEDVVNFNNRYINNELQIMFSELNIEISQYEINKACKELRNNRSGGSDCLINEFFKYGSETLIHYLYTLFNKIFELEYFPEKWNNSIMIPLHKKGSINSVENYRGISLLSHFGKLFTRILNNRLNTWAEKYNVYVEAQAGFRKGMSTVDNIFVLNAAISHSLNSNKKLYVAMIDYSKAYDYVVRDILWNKLIKIGIRGRILNIIKSMYNSLKTTIRVNGVLSESYANYIGLAQGECLSSFLFSLYLNDLEESLIINGAEGIQLDMFKLFVLLYADDIVIFAESKDSLQNSLNILHEYCQRSKLTVNVTKSKIMIFRKGRISQDVQFTYNNEQIDIVQTFNYLGVKVSSGGSFSHACESLAGQASKAIFKMKKYLAKFTNIKISHRLELFDKLILPILNYGSEVLGILNITKIERIHLKYCKEILGVKTQTQNEFIYGELGRMPLEKLRIIHMIRFWLKIKTNNPTKYIVYAYNMLIKDIETYPNKTNWAVTIKNILENMGFSHVWQNQGVENIKVFMSLFKQRVKDCYQQDWAGKINTSSRANTYKIFSDFSFKPYLDNIIVEKFRKSLTRLRLSSHRLKIETGRWHNPISIPVDQRKCEYCNKLEDEYHFLLECPLYETVRKQYINQHYWKRPNVLKFIELLKTENKNTSSKLSIFIYKSFEIKNQTLENTN